MRIYENVLKNNIFIVGSSVIESKFWKILKRDILEYWWLLMLFFEGLMLKILRKCNIYI